MPVLRAQDTFAFPRVVHTRAFQCPDALTAVLTLEGHSGAICQRER